MTEKYSFPFIIKESWARHFVFCEEEFGWECKVLFWTFKKMVFYKDIGTVEMVKGPLFPLSLREYTLKIMGGGSTKPLMTLNLTASDGKVRSAIIDIIAVQAPHAVLNNLANRVRNSYLG